MTLQLVDRSINYPRGVLEDVLVQIDTFVFPVDLVVLVMEPIHNTSSQIPVIFRRPFLATIDATIKIKSGIMTLVFENISLNVKILSNLRLEDFDEEEEVSCIEVVTEQSLDLIFQKDPVESALISLLTNQGCYTPLEEEMRQICSVL